MNDQENKNANATGEPADVSPSKETKKIKEKKSSGTNALKAIGMAACRRHSLKQAWVTTDGQTFANESDAINHASNLNEKEILKVTA